MSRLKQLADRVWPLERAPWTGPLLTLAAIAVLTSLGPTPLTALAPAAVLTVTVFYAAACGGWKPGFASAVITLLYCGLFYSELVLEAGLAPEGVAALAGIALGELVAVLLGTGLYGVLERERSARAALVASDARLHTFVDQVKDYAIFMLSPDGRAASWNEGVERVLGYDEREFIGLPAEAALTPEDVAAGVHLQELEHAVLTGRASDDRWMRRRNGSRFFALGTTSAVRDDGGRLAGFTKVMRDHTESVQAEASRRELAERYRLVTQATNDVIWDWDVATNHLQWNEAVTARFGYSPEELGTGVARWTDDLHPDDHERVLRRLHDAIESGGSVWTDEYRFARWDGSYANVYDRGVVSRDAAGRAVRIVGSMLVLTERYEAEEALRQSEERYRSLAAALGAVVWTSDAGGGFLGPQPSWEAYTGQTWEEYRGWRWLDAVHPDDREELARRWRAALSEQRPYGANGRLWHAESRRYRRCEARAVPLLNGNGTVREWVGVVADVEQQRQAEEQLQQAQRIQAVGKLAGGVAHEVNNMMTAVIGFGEFVLKDLGPSHPQRADVQEILRAGHRAAAVSRQLLAFSRQQILQPTVLSLNLVIEELAAPLARLLGADKELRLRLDPEAGRVRADRSQLEQILVNLAVNGRDAMASVGRLTIETAVVTLDAEYAAAHSNVSMRSGRYALLAVSDTGVGMTPDVQARVFEPFYTTKPVGQGTGLGLSTVYGIVKQSGGYIWLYSEPNFGTTVKVYLPLVQNEAEAPPQPILAPAPRGHETVLVVEDEPVVRSLARRALEGHGYQVLEAATGSEALELLARAGAAQVRLVVCDEVMPELNGRELGAELRRRQPMLPVHERLCGRRCRAAGTADGGRAVHPEALYPRAAGRAGARVARRGPVGDLNLRAQGAMEALAHLDALLGKPSCFDTHLFQALPRLLGTEPSRGGVEDAGSHRLGPLILQQQIVYGFASQLGHRAAPVGGEHLEPPEEIGRNAGAELLEAQERRVLHRNGTKLNIGN